MTLEQQLAGRLVGEVAIVGVGNPLRGDDAAGSILARQLQASGVAALDVEEVPESFLGQILAAGPRVVVLVDAVDLGAAPGSVALLEKDELARVSPLTHRTPLSLVMEFLERESGADVFVLGIQPLRLELGAPPSREVLESVRALAATLVGLLPIRPAGVAGRPIQVTEGMGPC